MATRVVSRPWLLFIAAILVAFPTWPLPVSGAERAALIAPPADWVEQRTGIATPALPDDGRASYGRRYLLIEAQVHVPTSATYHHNAYQILNAEGLDDSAQVRLSFDPDYETLTIHHVRIRRGSEIIEKLAPERIQTIQQERDLDRLLYNGELTSLLILDDVRIGDVVDLAFTRQGNNPVFGSHYLSSFSLGWSVPVARQSLRVIAEEDSRLRHRLVSDVAIAPEIGQTPRGRELRWLREDAPPLLADNNTPSWFADYPAIQFTDFPSWAAVVDWALPLYDNTGEHDDVLVDRALDIQASRPAPEARALAALDFVQNEIRYMGFEMGAGSHRPSPPGEVLRRRYGDCKDKTRLLCALLERLGIRAAPVLVHSQLRQAIAERLPSPLVFDHVVVALWIGDKVYQVDPTISHQRGPLDERHTNCFGLGLIVASGTTGPTAFPATENDVSATAVTEVFDVHALQGITDFRVTTLYRGRAARTMRATLQEQTAEELLKSYHNFYGRYYPDIVAAKPVTWDDDPAHDRLNVHEAYRINAVFAKEDEGAQLRADFYPTILNGYTASPGALGRKTPLAISHPIDLRSHTTINLPKDWSFTPRKQEESGPAFDFLRTVSGTARSIQLEYRWRTKADHVSPADFAEHVRLLAKIGNVLNYQLSYTPATPASPDAKGGEVFRLNWAMVALAVATLLVAVGGAIAAIVLPRPEPPLLEARGHGEGALVGLGGWLVLVGFGCVLRPFVIAAQFGTLFPTYFNSVLWSQLTNPESGTYRPHYGLLLGSEMCANLLMFAASLLLILLFFQKKRLYPKIAVGLLAFQLVVVIADTWAAGVINPVSDSSTGSNLQDAIRMAINAAIWIPYHLVSQRVKATFTR